ncbi:MAG: metabolite traffic protein EboE [Burkholderiales bacterium]|nr:metabolite traffic protein EboE [Burkholderiales bacterium]
MRIGAQAHLTYCSNIHPGETWPEVQANIERHVPAIRDRLAPEAVFGIGLRLSARAATELAEPAALEAFQDFLAENGLYVFTLNGFPYGTFHGTRVKEAVYQPDWRDPERLRYTNQLADLLAALLPDHDDIEGTVSTVPGAFKPEVRSAADVAAMAEHLLQHAAHLVELHRRTGRRIALALEPEPHCFLETVAETIAFFRDHLHSAAAQARLAALTGLTEADAGIALRRHLGVCHDLCHAAVEFEDPLRSLDDLEAAGITIGKLQISAGLRIEALTPAAMQALEAFQDPVYLHQVVESASGGVRRFVDLPQAFASVPGASASGAREWRVHFHVPVFLEALGAFGSTQAFVRAVLARHRERPVSRHLEVETYTWNVLPEHLRTVDMTEAIARELAWVREQLTTVVPVNERPLRDSELPRTKA